MWIEFFFKYHKYYINSQKIKYVSIIMNGNSKILYANFHLSKIAHGIYTHDILKKKIVYRSRHW